MRLLALLLLPLSALAQAPAGAPASTVILDTAWEAPPHELHAVELPPEIAAELRARGVTPGQRALLVVGSVAGGLGSVALIGPFGPLGSVAGTYVTAQLIGIDVSVGEVAFDGLLGLGVGAAVGYGLYGALQFTDAYPDEITPALVGAGAGLIAMSVATALFVRATPAVLPGPDGRAVPGVALRVEL